MTWPILTLELQGQSAACWDAVLSAINRWCSPQQQYYTSWHKDLDPSYQTSPSLSVWNILHQLNQYQRLLISWIFLSRGDLHTWHNIGTLLPFLEMHLLSFLEVHYVRTLLISTELIWTSISYHDACISSGTQWYLCDWFIILVLKLNDLLLTCFMMVLTFFMTVPHSDMKWRHWLAFEGIQFLLF